jgi:hypothetical protein
MVTFFSVERVQKNAGFQSAFEEKEEAGFTAVLLDKGEAEELLRCSVNP